MNLNKIVIHEIRKEPRTNDAELILSEESLPVNTESIELVETLLESYKGDKIHYAIFDESPGKYFPPRFKSYIDSERTDANFLEFTTDIVGNLEAIIRGKTLAKGGYLAIAEYTKSGVSYISIFLIRDTEGKILRKDGRAYTIHSIEYLDTNNLAMACRINESSINATDLNSSYKCNFC